MSVILRLLLAHMLGDFVAQSCLVLCAVPLSTPV
jgi:hypothetical protein